MEDVAAYLLALANAPDYALTFADPLETEIVRFPATLDPQVCREAVTVGRGLVDAWTTCPVLSATRGADSTLVTTTSLSVS